MATGFSPQISPESTPSWQDSEARYSYKSAILDCRMQGGDESGPNAPMIPVSQNTG
jgi:hypothetical protein